MRVIDNIILSFLFICLIISGSHASTCNDHDQPLPKEIRVVSFDGGGTRGYISARVLQEVEKHMNGNKTATQADWFAGTSTGGIIAAYLAKAGSEEQAKDYNALKNILNLYRNQAKDIFTYNFGRSLMKYTDELYDEEELEKILQDYMQETTFKDLKKSLVLTSVDIGKIAPEGPVPFIMSSRDKGMAKVKLWQASRATSAAPTYFQAYMELKYNKYKPILIDGGVMSNHPGQIAVQEIVKAYPTYDPIAVQSNIRMVSIGTGNYATGFTSQNAKDLGLVDWASKIADVCVGTTSKVINTHLAATLGKNRYIRLNMNLPYELALDASNAKHFTAMENVVLNYAQQHPKALTNAARMLTGQPLAS